MKPAGKSETPAVLLKRAAEQLCAWDFDYSCKGSSPERTIGYLELVPAADQSELAYLELYGRRNDLQSYSQAVEYFKTISEQSTELRQKAKASSHRLREKHSDARLAVEPFAEALKLREENPTTWQGEPKYVLETITLTYASAGNYTDAAKLALELMAQSNEPQQWSERFTSYIQHIDKVDDLSKRAELVAGFANSGKAKNIVVAKAYYDLGTAEKAAGMHMEARDHFEKALPYATETEYPRKLLLLNRISLEDPYLGRWNDYIMDASAAVDEGKKEKAADAAMVSLYDVLGDAYVTKGNFAEVERGT